MSEISKIKVITLTPFTSSEYHVWTASALTIFKVYKVDKLVLGQEKEPKSDKPFNGSDKSHLQCQKDWEERNILMIKALSKWLNKIDKTKVFRMTEAAKIWSRLDKEYGHISDMRHNIAETALFALRKDSTISMGDYTTSLPAWFKKSIFIDPKKSPR